MIKARLWRGDAHRLEHVGDADCGDIRRQDRLTPERRNDEGLRREIVNFLRLYFLGDPNKAEDVAEIAIMQMDLVRDPEPAQAMILDAAMRRSADDPMYLIALQQQKLRQIGAVLSSDSRQ